jgi:tRNA (guanine10-N2)-dimethyltransferase
VNETNKLCIVLLGDIVDLAEKEVLFAIESLNIEYKYLGRIGLLLFLETYEKLAEYLCYRCSMVREVTKIILESDLLNFYNKINLDLFNIERNKTICVRIKSYDNKYKPEVRNMESKIGEIFYDGGYKVNLEKPDVLIRGYIINEKIFLGILLAKSSRKEYEERRPSKRKVFHSSSMIPKLARLFVNLSRAEINEFLVDPFCGVGGFLIEASYFIKYCIGIDIDINMLKGAKENLKFYNIYNVDLINASALKLPLRKLKYVATDTPYGIASSTKGIKHDELIRNFLNELSNYKGVSACILTTKSDINNNFKILLKYSQRVRSSLIRWIYVLTIN